MFVPKWHFRTSWEMPMAEPRLISAIGSFVGHDLSKTEYFHSNAREDSGALGQGENYPKPVRRRLGGQGWEDTQSQARTPATLQVAGVPFF